jgi:hypothetical protein
MINHQQLRLLSRLKIIITFHQAKLYYVHCKFLFNTNYISFPVKTTTLLVTVSEVFFATNLTFYSPNAILLNNIWVITEVAV